MIVENGVVKTLNVEDEARRQCLGRRDDPAAAVGSVLRFVMAGFARP